MKRPKLWIRTATLLALMVANTVVLADLPAEQVEAARKRWGEYITKLLTQDREEKHPDDSVLFLGSSSVRLWDSIERDMAPYHPIQRGYGGARFSDLVVFSKDLVAAHRYRAVVIFVGNDVTGKETDATSKQVVDWFLQVAADARAHQPAAEVFCVEITPTPSRWTAWPKIQEVNTALRAACKSDPKLHLISTSKSYLNEDGEPRPEYFKKDRLHQNEDGYAVWAGLIKAALREVIGE